MATDDLPWETRGKPGGNHAETMGKPWETFSSSWQIMTTWLGWLAIYHFSGGNHAFVGLETAWFATARCLWITASLWQLDVGFRSLILDGNCSLISLYAPAIADHTWFCSRVPMTVGNCQAYQRIPLIVVSYVVTTEPLAEVFFGDIHNFGKRRINKCALNQPECSQLFNFQ